MSSSRDQIRREVRSRRRSISSSDRAAAARSFAVIADRMHLLRPGARIALYQAYGSEADPKFITRKALARGCEVFLPVITQRRTSRMHFFAFERDARLVRNSFGIFEPARKASARISPRRLDIIFMPLVAFDDRGSRLGSGAGFYDRCVRHLHVGRRWRRPKLIGVAFAQQRVEQLQSASWDIPMDAVITERSFQRFRRQH